METRELISNVGEKSQGMAASMGALAARSIRHPRFSRRSVHVTFRRIAQVASAVALGGVFALNTVPALACEQPVSKKAAKTAAAQPVVQPHAIPPVKEVTLTQPTTGRGTPGGPPERRPVPTPPVKEVTGPKPVKPVTPVANPVVHHPLDKVPAPQPPQVPAQTGTKGSAQQVYAPKPVEPATSVKEAEKPAAAVVTVPAEAQGKPIPETAKTLAPCAKDAVKLTSMDSEQGKSGTADFTVTGSCQIHLVFQDFTLQHRYYSTSETQFPYDAKQGDFGPGQHSLTIQVPNCWYQIDFSAEKAPYAPAPGGIHPDYHGGSSLYRGDVLGDQPCVPLDQYQPPPPVVQPPVVKPPIHVDCGKGFQHPAGDNEKCVPIAVAPKPTQSPVSTPVAQQPQAPVLSAPQGHEVARSKATPISHPLVVNNNRPLAATVASNGGRSSLPLAPVTGSGPSQLAETGSNGFLVPGVGLAGLLTILIGYAIYRRNRVEVEQS